MTVLLAYANPQGEVWMGGDSAAHKGWTRHTYPGGKIVHRDNMLIGVAGIARIIQLIQFMPMLKHDPEKTHEEYLVMSFIPTLRETLIRHGIDLNPDTFEAGLLIGYGGAVWRVDPNFGVMSCVENLYWLGHGGDMAAGAFLAFLDQGVPVESAMTSAMALAGKFDSSIAGPYYALQL